MARCDAVWAMPPNPQHAHRLACKCLLHLALRLRCGIPGCEDDSGEHGNRSKLWFQHGCVVRLGIAVEQLALSSDLPGKRKDLIAFLTERPGGVGWFKVDSFSTWSCSFQDEDLTFN
eukprot:6489621-Amphidinium_carterae.1